MQYCLHIAWDISFKQYPDVASENTMPTMSYPMVLRDIARSYAPIRENGISNNTSNDACSARKTSTNIVYPIQRGKAVYGLQIPLKLAVCRRSKYFTLLTQYLVTHILCGESLVSTKSQTPYAVQMLSIPRQFCVQCLPNACGHSRPR